ncbi:Uncharacterised protein [Streptococcus equi subsp. zooepidemicus]|uniref:Uncharacterized protein n=1 Tax=Streptococcus equi subsp. zooepidemicus TaxID=40041 RepID=A0A2X3TE73_STRSZ|nr:hypothetical protein IEMOCGPF_01766 [Streptococcus equi subsp. zooepidemicus]SQF04713.1 Uncharacterised protein [Streptococcus equi subsp. zooepidemicus]VEF09124.1 Uncharacterised protein [Streptococcus equi subsp. zooepidemicus]
MVISDSSYNELAEQLCNVEPSKAKSNDVVQYDLDKQETS